MLDPQPRRYPRLPLARRSTFQTSPQRAQRQYVSVVIVLLVVVMLTD